MSNLNHEKYGVDRESGPQLYRPAMQGPGGFSFTFAMRTMVESSSMVPSVRQLFRLMSPDQKAVLFANTARALGDAPREIKIRHIGNCQKADPAYGKGVADALGIPLSEIRTTS